MGEGPPQYSADGRWWWNGQQWIAAHRAPPQYSADGRWWWNGQQWIQAAGHHPPPKREPAAADVAGSETSNFLARARAAWLPLLYVVIFAWLDWITNRSVLFILFVGGLAVATLLYPEELTGRLAQLLRNVSDQAAKAVDSTYQSWQRSPLWLRRAAVGLVPLTYFLLRGQGTSEAGGTVTIAILLLLAVTAGSGRIDAVLGPYYSVRNRLLPAAVRAAVALGLAILIAFAVVHGSLRDIVALFGGATVDSQAPTGLQGRFFVAVLLSGACAFLLMREADADLR